jgi:TNF receptor-associated factor 5
MRLDVWQREFSKHNVPSNIYKAYLNKNKEQFKLQEVACYNGKFICKVTDYKIKKKEAVD